MNVKLYDGRVQNGEVKSLRSDGDDGDDDDDDDDDDLANQEIYFESVRRSVE